MIVLEALCAIFFICLGAFLSACEAVANGLRRLLSNSRQTSGPANNNPQPAPAPQPQPVPAPGPQPEPAAEGCGTEPDRSSGNAGDPAAGTNQESATMTTAPPATKFVCKTAWATDVGRKRVHNEDGSFVADDNCVAAVADGMGGHASGEVASGIAVKTFRGQLCDAGSRTWNGEDEVQSALLATIARANSHINAHSIANRHCNGMGTTVVAMAFLKEDVHVAHVGDSRAYRLRGGALELLTKDHSLVNKLIDDGMLKPEDAETFSHRNVITRALGEKNSTPDHMQFAPARGDLLLLCSDGLNGEVSDKRIAEILRGADEGNLQQICDQLIAAALAGGGSDNITVVLVMFC